MLTLSRKTVRSSWRAYAGAFTALAFGIVLIALTVTMIGSVETTARRAGADDAARAQLEDLSAMFGFMSAISLFMALFVVASTFGFVVATRQRELGLLRLVGATPKQVRRLLLGEAVVVAIGATVVGGLLATALGPVTLTAVRMVGATSLHLDAPPVWVPWAVAAPTGLVVALLGSRRAAKRASKVAPVAALREAALERRRPGVGAVLTGAVAVAAVVAVVLLSGRMPPVAAMLVGILLPLLVVVALTALGPVVVPWLAGVVARPFARRSVAARLAADELRTSVRTTSAVAAPVTAIAAIAGSLVVTMGFTVDWSHALNATQLAAPVVVTDPGAARRLAADPAVGAVDARRTVPVSFDETGPQDVDVVDVERAAQSRRLRAVRGDLDDLRGRTLAASESWMFDSGVRLGGHVNARLDEGRTLRLKVVAVVPDAADLYGDLMVPADLAGRRASEPSVLFVSPAPGVSDRELLTATRAVAADAAVPADQWMDDIASSTRRMNTVALLVLLGPAGIYAGIAIVNATLIGAAQRSRQRRLLALLGATPRQVRSTALWQAGLTTATGLVLGGATTLLVGWLVWTAITRDVGDQLLTMTVPWLPLVTTAGVCAALALLAARVSARR
ncbi:ABC transporter permease [Mumia quercus]|uniref:ABC transporter permease n=1 Tax=Mumia quercus TaxID=2976125 RepID=UPI0021D35EDB|nr:ABC transporter permease [Mumia quercus]